MANAIILNGIPATPPIAVADEMKTELARFHCACGYVAVARSAASANASYDAHKKAVHQ